MKNKQNLIIADPDLINFDGHCYNYDKSIHAACAYQGIECDILGNLRVNEAIREEMGVYPLFTHSFGYAPKRPKWQICLTEAMDAIFRVLCALRLMTSKRRTSLYNKIRSTLHAPLIFRFQERAFYEDLTRIPEGVSCKKNTLILFHTILPPQITPILTWLKTFSDENRPRVALLFRYSLLEKKLNAKKNMKLSLKAFDELAACMQANRICLYTDSKPLAEEYKAITGLHFDVLPIPHVRAAPAKESHRDPYQPVKIGYIGQCRESKGFHYLPDLVRELRPLIDDGAINFVVQLNSTKTGNPICKQALKKLKQLPVELVEGGLSEDVYYKLLDSLDIILFPYSPEEYKCQTSGIFSEALAMGKIPVVTKGTWMDSVLRENKIDLAFEEGSINELKALVLVVIKDFPVFKEKISILARKWHRYNDAHNFLSILFSLD